MNNQAGKGDSIRKGANFEKFRAGFDTIDWGSSRAKKKESVRPPDESEALIKAKEIRARLTREYSQPKVVAETGSCAIQNMKLDEIYLKNMLTET